MSTRTSKAVAASAVKKPVARRAIGERACIAQRVASSTSLSDASAEPPVSIVADRLHLAFYGSRCLPVCFPIDAHPGDLEWHAKGLASVLGALVRASRVAFETEDDSDPVAWASNVAAGVELVAGIQQALIAEIRERAKREMPV